MRIINRFRIFSVIFSLLAVTLLGVVYMVDKSELVYRADLAVARSLHQETNNMLSYTGLFLATNESRFLKAIKNSSASSLKLVEALSASKSVQDKETSDLYKKINDEFNFSIKNLDQLAQDYKRGNTARQARSTQLLIANYQLLINDLLLLEESMDSSWNMFFRFEKYMTYVSMVFLLLAALLIDVAVSRWVLRAISNALTSISRAMSEIVNQTGKNEILADQQFASISEAATSVQNISASAISSKNNAIQTSGLAFQANALAKDGVEIVEKVHSAVVELKEKMLLINQHIDLASNHSKSIDQIAAQVQSQSEEINMLAINSAIQAMDAGEYGKGFMVLSNEIRELADLSKLLAVQTGERVLAIQQSTASSVTFANNGVQSIETVVDLCNRVNQLFGDLVRIIEKVGKNSQEVAADSNQQSAALIQLNQVALRISEGSQETALHIKETRTSMDNIKLSMQKLQKLI